MAHLSDFPDEVLCKIFEYLSPFDALYSFINLNMHFNRLLTPFKQQIDLTHLSYEQFMYYINTLLPIINKDEPLYAIKLGNKHTPGQIKLFNTLICDKNYHNYFNNIDKVLIECPYIEDLNDFIENVLVHLSKLVTLSIKIEYIRDIDFQTWTKLFVNFILSISNLVKLSIDIPSGLTLSRLSNTTILNSLIDITLNIKIVTDLLILIQCIPNIEKLSIRITWWTSGDANFVRMLNEMNSNNKISLNYLKKFHLTIDSIITFQFDHLEQVLHKILNNQTTYKFTFIIQNCLNNNNEIIRLIDGQQWEKFLSLYTLLNQFELFIQMRGSFKNDEDVNKINLFKSKYFIKKNWFFYYLQNLFKDTILFFSIPCKNKELFHTSINNHKIFNKFPINSISKLLIDQTNNDNYQFDQSIMHFILNHFPFLQELHLINFDINFLQTKSIHIQSLHTLNIERAQNINLSSLLQLLPLINTLFMSYFTVYDFDQTFNIHKYNRIIELSLIDVPVNNDNQILLFLNQFPNLRFLHILMEKRGVTDEYLLRNLNEIMQKFHSLIYFKLELGKNVNSSTNWINNFNGRVKMYLNEIIDDGILVHLWF